MLPFEAAGTLAASAVPATAPVRAAYLYFPNGACMNAWVPTQPGAITSCHTA